MNEYNEYLKTILFSKDEIDNIENKFKEENLFYSEDHKEKVIMLKYKHFSILRHIKDKYGYILNDKNKIMSKSEFENLLKMRAFW